MTYAADGIDPKTWAGGGQLYVGDRRAVLAREPNMDDYWFVRAPVRVPGETDKDSGSEAFTAAGNAQSWLSGLPAPDKSRALLHVMQVWTSGYHRLADSAPEGAIRVTPRSTWPFLSRGTNQRFYVENVAKALDAPGEWIGDGKEVRYIPRPDQAGKAAQAVLPRIDVLMAVRGDPASQQLVRNVEFRGLVFEHSRYLVPPEGFQDNQAASRIGAAIEIDGASGIVFDRCKFAHTGTYALWFRQSVRESRVSNSEFTDLGAGAVRVGLTKQAADDPTATGAITVAENTISDTGHVYPGAVAVWIGQSFDNVVSDNEIFDTTYTAISVGWSWGYAAATSGRNQIVNNLLHDIGLGHLEDMGGIYTLGVSPGTVISGNVIREVRGYDGYGYGAFGIYNDQGTSGLTIRDNIVIGTDTGAYHLHFGRDNVVAGNVFAYGRLAEFRVTKPEPDNNLQVTDNLFVPQGRQPFDGRMAGSGVQFRGNITSDTASGGKVDQASCGGGCTLRSVGIQASPSDARDIRFTGLDGQTTSRLARIVAQAGPQSAPDRKAKAMMAAPAVQSRSAAVAPPVPVQLDLASVPVGQRPAGLRYAPPNDLEAIHVVAKDGAPGGGRCLQFNDGPRLEHRSEPNAYALLNHVQGHSTSSFYIQYDNATEFIHEWRDNGRPFLTGPSLTIGRDGVKAGGRVVAKPRPGEWLGVTITAPLGGGAPGRWQLELREGGGQPRRFDDLPFGSPGWSRLSWIGFISNAQVETSLCLADLRVVGDPN